MILTGVISAINLDSDGKRRRLTIDFKQGGYLVYCPPENEAFDFGTRVVLNIEVTEDKENKINEFPSKI